jgi:hypothetical protein
LEANLTQKARPNTTQTFYIVEENRRNMDEFEYTSQSVKTLLNTCKERLKERTEKISLFGYQSKERIRKHLRHMIKDSNG